MIGSMLPSGDVAEDVDDYLRGFGHRTTMLLGAERVERLRGKTVAIAGCGGVGGACAMTLARLGVGGFVLADPGIFDPPDANRQWASTRVTLGRNKAEVHADILRQINPRVRLQVHPEGINEDNLDTFMSGADVLLDCLDISLPLSLRGRVYRSAMAKGIYALTSPIFGFGTLIIVAEPGGMGMDGIIDDFVRVASTESKLPAGFPDHFFQPHVDAIEGEIHKHRVPTCGISVTLSTGLVAAEIARILLRDTYPGLAGPPVLPQVFAVEPLRRTFRVMHYTELFREHAARDRAARERSLAEAFQNAVLLPSARIEADRLSDSASDHTGSIPEPAGSDLHAAEILTRMYGYPQTFPLFRGRFAEALLAPLVVRPGSAVATVAPFPTTRFHLSAAGGRVVEVGTTGDPRFGGNVDLDALAGVLATGDVSAVWLEPCNNALGGAPISLANLRAVREQALAAGVPVVLDATRIWENAVLVREREAPELSLSEIVLRCCAASDACAASLTKDFRTPVGGFVGVRSDTLAQAIRERTFMVGDGLGRDALATLAGHLSGALARGVEAPARVAAARALAAKLEAVGAPVVRPLGGHAVWVDAAAALPHLGPADNAEYVLAGALYVESGVRVAPNMCTPEQSAAGQRWIRIAVPIGVPDVDDRLVAGMKAVLAEPGRWRGLTETPGGPGGVLGAFVRHFVVRG